MRCAVAFVAASQVQNRDAKKGEETMMRSGACFFILLGAACIAPPDEQAAVPLVTTCDDGGYDYDTPCGTDGGPDCAQGWCMNASDSCAEGYIATCDPLFVVVSSCVPDGLPAPPDPPVVCETTLPVGVDQSATLLSRTHFDPDDVHLEVGVVAGDAQDMTGWVDPLGAKGKVKITTNDGSLNGKYEVVKKTKDEIEIKVTGGGLAADFDPRDPLVIKLYNQCGKQKYSSTGTVRIIGGKRVSLKAGPDDVDVSKGGGGVITIKQGGKEITITPKGDNTGAKLDGGDAKMDFKKD
ncbi:MAG TPA: hypothetical protein VIV11_41620 [Kofleriaceae bacterium]